MTKQPHTLSVMGEEAQVQSVWIQSHQNVERHPKVLLLKELQGWSLDETIGKLHRFWWWCLEFAEDGNLERHPHAVIAASIDIPSDCASTFVSHMVTVKLLDATPYLRVHDWWQGVGQSLKLRYKKQPAKWQHIRDLYEQDAVLTVEVPLIPAEPHPIARAARKELTLVEPDPMDGFSDFYQAYPRKQGKADAIRAWKKLKPTADLYAAIMTALEKHKASRQWQKDGGEFIPLPATWLNKRRWEDEGTTPVDPLVSTMHHLLRG